MENNIVYATQIISHRGFPLRTTGISLRQTGIFHASSPVSLGQSADPLWVAATDDDQMKKRLTHSYFCVY